jgi:hypothetical protein
LTGLLMRVAPLPTPHAHGQVLGERSVPCPDLDLSGGFRAYFDAALNTTSSPPFDPFKRDVNFLLATWSLEEIGATGDKVGHLAAGSAEPQQRALPVSMHCQCAECTAMCLARRW